MSETPLPHSPPISGPEARYDDKKARARYALQRSREGLHWQHQTLDLARELGWRTIGTRGVRVGRHYRVGLIGDSKGWPDTLCVRGPRLLIAECKLTSRTELTSDSEQWLSALEAVEQIEVHVWRGDRPDEVIEALK